MHTLCTIPSQILSPSCLHHPYIPSVEISIFSLSLSPEASDGWFDIEDSKNQNIYISGLPHDITLEEFADLMSKYGIIMEDDEGGCGLLMRVGVVYCSVYDVKVFVVVFR